MAFQQVYILVSLFFQLISTYFYFHCFINWLKNLDILKLFLSIFQNILCLKIWKEGLNNISLDLIYRSSQCESLFSLQVRSPGVDRRNTKRGRRSGQEFPRNWDQSRADGNGHVVSSPGSRGCKEALFQPEVSTATGHSRLSGVYIECAAACADHWANYRHNRQITLDVNLLFTELKTILLWCEIYTHCHSQTLVNYRYSAMNSI